MYQAVVECRSKNTLTGDDVWVGRLACGCEFSRLKRRRRARTAKPAPLRMKCAKHPEVRR